MGILDLHKREKNPPYTWNAPSYYDHPDGEDLKGKLSFVLKNTTTLATFFGVIYAGRPPTTDTVGKLVRIARFTLPGAAMGFTFTCVTYCSTVFRKKDDPLNHGLGGVAAGLLLGPAMGSPQFSTVGAVVLGSLAYFNKFTNTDGYSLFSQILRRNYSSFFLRHLDTTKQPELKGNWTRDA